MTKIFGSFLLCSIGDVGVMVTVGGGWVEVSRIPLKSVFLLHDAFVPPDKWVKYMHEIEGYTLFQLLWQQSFLRSSQAPVMEHQPKAKNLFLNPLQRATNHKYSCPHHWHRYATALDHLCLFLLNICFCGNYSSFFGNWVLGSETPHRFHPLFPWLLP